MIYQPLLCLYLCISDDDDPEICSDDSDDDPINLT
jgi:hypothetical protein